MFKKNLSILVLLSVLPLVIGLAVVDQVGLKEQVGEAIVSSKDYTPASTTRRQKGRGDYCEMRLPESWSVVVTFPATPNSRCRVFVTKARYNTLESGARCQVKYEVSRIFKAVSIHSID